MNKFTERLEVEKKDLEVKIDRLTRFMQSDEFSELKAIEQGLLMVQIRQMNSYNETLSTRLEMYLEVDVG